MKNKKRLLLMLLVTIGFIALYTKVVQAAPDNTIGVPSINVDFGGEGTPTDYVNNIKLLVVLSVLTLLPAVVIMVTSFTRIAVVFSFIKNALGAQQSIPNQVLTGLAIFLTIFIMAPVYKEVNEKALIPYSEEKITQDEAVKLGVKPIKDFMLKQTRQKDLELFVESAKLEKEDLTKESIPLYVVVPAFAISELKTAFQIGFLIFLPFIIIDIVVGSVLMSMGMFMLPPAMVSLPFKLLVFVMVDGWYLLIKSLILSFG